ncbi:hypothetical protein DPMN_155797 [Dreissena polymorpha]|uniref:Uncharacterized protein n=2 Tax=Dreissena polymorpha TaxID=45954 RepID=A0A9D4FUD7_DREPO|nr:hypothetical protein DPMN_155797 [Dreissena polymorpha]
MYYNSTFLASVTPPVFMTDNDDENSQSYEGSVTSGTENWDAMADEDFSVSLVFLLRSTCGQIIPISVSFMEQKTFW